MAKKNRVKKIKMKLDHIAYAVKSTDEAIKAFSPIYPNVLNYKSLEKSQNVLLTYLSNNYESYMIELVEGASTPNPVENMLKTKDTVLYHLCYKVKNINKAIDYLKSKKYFMITKPFKTSINKKMLACHFYNPKAGIIEITGENKNN